MCVCVYVGNRVGNRVCKYVCCICVHVCVTYAHKRLCICVSARMFFCVSVCLHVYVCM